MKKLISIKKDKANQLYLEVCENKATNTYQETNYFPRLELFFLYEQVERKRNINETAM